MATRGEVEDTRLEAKAKETKKNPRPRTVFPRTDTLEAKDRNARGQGLRTQAQVLSKKKKKKKVFTKIFQAISTKKRQNFNNSKSSAVLEPRTGQFSRTRGQGQGLQNVSSRTPPLMATDILS